MHINEVFFFHITPMKLELYCLLLHFYGQNFLIIAQIDFMEYKLILIHS